MPQTLPEKIALTTWLVMPWRTSHASMRWLMLVLMAGALATALILGIHTDDPKVWRVGTVLCSASVAGAWAFWLSAGVLTAIDARGLRVPGAERAVVHSLLLCGALTTGVPALILGAFGDNALQALSWLALGASAGLAFALLPRWCAMVMGFLPMLATGLRAHGLPLHQFTTPSTSIFALVALLAAIVWRWHVLLREGGGKALGFGSAIVLQYRRQSTGVDVTGLGQMDGPGLIRQRPDWLQPQAVLGSAGPATPVLALRIALGGQYLPKTLGSRLRTWGFAALILLGVSALLAFEGNDDAHVAIWHAIGPSLAGAMVFFGALGMAFSTDALVRLRWQRVNAELPLLALLPGLGDAAAQRRHLLHTVFRMPATILMLLFAAALAAPHFLPLHGLGLLLVALTPLAIGANLVASVLCTLGDDRLPGWGDWLRHVALAVVILTSTLVPFVTLDTPPSDMVDHLELASLIGWIALMPAIAWLIRRGWRAFQRRPHPFLPTTG